MAVVASATGAAVFGLSGVAAGVAGGALLGAGAGALYSGLTGDGNILNSALTGGLLGASVGGLGAAAAGTTAGGTALGAASAPSTLAAPTANVLTQVPAASLTSANPAALDALAASNKVFAEGAASLPGVGLTAAPEVITPQLMAATGAQSAPVSSTALTGKEMLGYGLAGTAAMSLLGSQNQSKIQTPSSPSYIRPYTYSQTRNPNAGQPGQSYYNQSYTAQPVYQAAQGGLMSIGGQTTMYPGSQQLTSQYATPSQMPISSNALDASYEPKINAYTGEMNLAEGGQAESNSASQSVQVQSNPVSQNVLDYNKLIADRATQEYINSPQLAAFSAAPKPAASETPVTPETPVYDKGVAGLYQYYLGRKPAESEIAQYNMDPNVMATPEQANYFNKFTSGELAQTKYKPIGPDPFAAQANPTGLLNPSGLPGYSYNPFTRSYTASPMQPQMQAPMSFVPPPMANNMDMGGAGAGGGLMPNSLRFDRGGKADGQNMFEGISEKEKRSMIMDMINAKLESPKAQYVEGLGFMTPPPSVGGRLGGNMDALGGNIRAGVSGNVMQTPDKRLLAIPGMMDIGYTSKKESAYDPTFDVSLQRAIKSMPGRSNDYSVSANYTKPFMAGGQAGYNLGGYSDGGRLLKGPGDGMSDNIPASIGNRQPARLADGEFVIPADVVSHLGNGSTDAGAKKLYAMMDKVRNARTGNKKQGKQIKAEKYLKA